MTFNITVEDLKTMCRACMRTLADSDEFVSLEGEDLARSTFVMSTSIYVAPDDKLPLLICLTCLDKATELLEFKKTCQNNDAFMRMVVTESTANAKKSATGEEESMDASSVKEEADEDKDGGTKPKLQEPETDEFGNALVKCPICWQVCIGYKDFDLHSVTHVVAGNYTCPICGVRYARSDTYRDHMYVHTNLLFKCILCAREFTRRKALTDHHAQVHFIFKRKDTLTLKKEEEDRQEVLATLMEIPPDQQAGSNESSDDNEDCEDAARKTYRCPICSFKLKSEKEFDEHMGLHVSRSVRTCPICQQEFKRYETIKQHMWSHVEGLKFQCSVCQRILAHPKALKDHTRNNHSARVTTMVARPGEILPPPKDGEQHACQICGKQFLMMPALYRHIRTHARDKPHPCKHCPAVFRLELNLKTHMARHKKGAFSCQHCFETFETEAACDEHTLSHSTGSLCVTCGMILPTNTKLNMHIIKEHTGGFTCEECGARFDTPSRLERHVLEHRGDAFPCPVCGKRFGTHKSVTAHNRKVHVQPKSKKRSK